MNKEVIVKHVAEFNEKFNDLDRLIDIAKYTLSVKVNAPIELVNRVAQYKKIVEKQRVYANQLLEIKEGKKQLDEILRITKLITASTKMIYEDAKEILAELKGYNQ
jgi:uncharacterized protein (DUF2344 family)